MTGKQIHSIVHRLDVVGSMREAAYADLLEGRAARARRTRQASDKVMGRVYRDLGRWMSHAQCREFGSCADRAYQHRQHAIAKRYPTAA